MLTITRKRVLLTVVTLALALVLAYAVAFALFMRDTGEALHAIAGAQHAPAAPAQPAPGRDGRTKHRSWPPITQQLTRK